MKTWALCGVLISSLAVVACGTKASTSGAGGATGAGGDAATGGSAAATNPAGTGTTNPAGTTTGTTGTGGSDTTATTGTTGTTGTGGTGGSAMGCGSADFPGGLPDCTTCLQGECCAELAACDTGTACGDFFACATACDPADTACQGACQTNMAAGFADAQALNDCYMNGACISTSDCATGAICDSGLQNNNVACGACESTNCCGEWDACTADSDCKDCALGTGTGCDTNTLFQATKTCDANNCATTCPAGICDSGLSTQNVACDSCMGSMCCTQADACVNDTTCAACLVASPAASCATNTLYKAIGTCQTANCHTQCM